MRASETSPSSRVSPGTVLVRRPRLEEALSASQRITVLRAPAGFGKSTLLRQWSRLRATDGVGWLAMSHDTATIDGFWKAFASAVSAATGEIGAPTTGAESELPRIRAITHVRSLTAPLSIVVDGFEHVEHLALERSLFEILHLAPHLRLIVATRSENVFIRRRLREFSSLIIGADELCFTEPELRELLEENGAAATLSVALHAEASGWPGLSAEVATRVASEPVSSDSAIEAIASEHLREYNDEHLRDARLRDIALRLSVCDTVTAEITRHLVGETALRLARTLASGGLLSLTQTQDGRRVYRWPRLAQKFLQDEFQRRSPSEFRATHASLAAWFHARYDPAAALRHAVRAEDWPRAVAVIEEQWVFLFPDAYDVLTHALDAIPRSFSLASSGVLAVGEISSHWSESLIRDAIDRLPTPLPDETDELEQIALSPDALRRFNVALATMVALRVRGHVGRAHTIADRIERFASVSAHNPRMTPLVRRAPFHVQTGVSRLFAGDVDGALRSMRTARSARGSDAELRETVDATSKTALLHALRGSTREAERWLRRAEEDAVAAPWTRGFIAQTMALGEALIGLDRLEEERTTRALDVLAHPGVREPGWDLLVEYLHARRGLLWGDPEGALHQLRRARITHRAWLWDDSLGRALLDGIESDLLLSLGRATEASTLLATPLAHPITAAAFGRVQLVGGAPAHALSIADEALSRPSLLPRTRIEFHVLVGQGYARLGEQVLSAAAYARARTAAANKECWQPLTLTADHAPSLRAALPGRLSDYASPLPSGATIIDLTDREREILTLLAAGGDRPSIARELYLSVNTVKFHMRSLYRKLGSSSAHEAVAIAVHHGLIRHAVAAGDPTA